MLVCTATLAWGINVPAYMTILKGCEYYDKAQDRYVEFDISEINQMCGRAGRPQFIQQRYKQWIREYFLIAAYTGLFMSSMRGQYASPM